MAADVRATATVTVIFTVTMTFSAAPAEAGRPCPYWVLVSREGFPQENIARVCDEDQMGTILRWMRVADAAVSRRAPQAPLNDGFTVTIGDEGRSRASCPSGSLGGPDGEGLSSSRIWSSRFRTRKSLVPWSEAFPAGLRRVRGMAIARRD